MISQWVDCMAETCLTLFLCIHSKKVFLYPILIAYSSNSMPQSKILYSNNWFYCFCFCLIKTISILGYSLVGCPLPIFWGCLAEQLITVNWTNVCVIVLPYSILVFFFFLWFWFCPKGNFRFTNIDWMIMAKYFSKE